MRPEYCVTLNPEDQKRVIEIAAARFQANRAGSVKDRSICGAIDIDLNGFGGEVAFCRLFEIEPDWSILPRSSALGTDSGDCVLNGKRIDVKTTSRLNGRLIAPRWKQPDVDYYVLMVGEFPSYECRGFMSVGELLQPSRLIDLGKGLTYAALQSDLILTRQQKAA